MNTINEMISFKTCTESYFIFYPALRLHILLNSTFHFYDVIIIKSKLRTLLINWFNIVGESR